MDRVCEWALFFLIDRERNGLTTKGRDLFWASDVEQLADFELVELEQSNVIPSLQKKIMGTTVIRLTEKGRHYFDR
jgi:hypothetical protein